MRDRSDRTFGADYRELVKYWTDLGLPVRAANGLLGDNICSIEELREVSAAELLRIPYFGKRCLRDVQILMTRYPPWKGLPMSDGVTQPQAQPAPPPQLSQVQLGEALINPNWQGHLIAMTDNGGDMVMFTVTHPRHGMINCLWSRTMAGNIRDWLTAALNAPVLTPQPPQPPQAAAVMPEGMKPN